MNPLLALVAGVLLAGVSSSVAQAQASTAAVAGTTFDGKPFQLSSLKGKVVLVMFWSTDCAVCRDKMPELRQNYQGWAGKPFEMVLVSTDRKMKGSDGTSISGMRLLNGPMLIRFRSITPKRVCSIVSFS